MCYATLTIYILTSSSHSFSYLQLHYPVMETVAWLANQDAKYQKGQSETP